MNNFLSNKPRAWRLFGLIDYLDLKEDTNLLTKKVKKSQKNPKKNKFYANINANWQKLEI